MPGVISAQQMPGNDHCMAPDATDHVESGQAAPRPQDSTSQKLSDCGGVLKPPATGDSELEKPAPRDGKTPVIPPGNVPGEQGDNTPQSK
jgi:hypothetical protein